MEEALAKYKIDDNNNNKNSGSSYKCRHVVVVNIHFVV